MLINSLRSMGKPYRWLRLRAVLAALALIVAAVSISPVVAQSQTATQVLVSNTAITNNDRGPALWVVDTAQGFTTGSNSAGYSLSSIKIKFKSTGSSLAAPTVKLVSGSVDATDGIALTGPSSLTADAYKLYEFTAPDNTTLTSSTKYWVVIESAATGGDDVAVGITTSPLPTATDEDTALPGWSIGDYPWLRRHDSTGSFEWSGRLDNPDKPSDGTFDPAQALVLSVHGTAIGGI